MGRSKHLKIIDLHCDTIYRMMKSNGITELRENDFSVDINKLKQGNSIAQFFALYVDLRECTDPLEECLEMLHRFYIELSKNKEAISIARNIDELMDNNRKGKISALLTVEEGGVIKGKLSHLRNLYRLGVRLITLTWNYPNEIGYPNYHKEYRVKGLTVFGEEVIHEMNQLGMLIDVSHLSDRGFYDVANITTKPFIASHSNARSIADHPRNLTDEMIRVLAEKGGVIGINFFSDFLGGGNTSKVEDIIRHIQHIKMVGGIDVISIGSDFDGMNCDMEISNIGEIDKLIQGLKSNGFTESEIEKICYKNALRIIRDVCR